jgi:hypothetical protein
MDDDKRKHLDYLQAIITRMNSNSFQLKNFSVVIISAMFVLFAATPKALFLFLTGFPLLIFWFLDAFYLQQERKFRALYNDVAGLTCQYAIKTYEMSTKEYKGNGYSFGECFFSKTILLFYGSLLVVVAAITVILLFVINISLV